MRMQKGNGKASTGHKVVICLKNYKLVWIRPQTVYFNFSLIHNVPVGETPTGSGLYRRVAIPACEELKYTHPKGIAGNQQKIAINCGTFVTKRCIIESV